MPITIGILTPNGLTEAPYTAETLTEAVQYETEGVYTLSVTFNRNQTLLLDAHLDRLEESAKLEKIRLKLDRDNLRRALRTLIDQSGYENCRFRITVPRKDPASLIITLEEYAGVPQTVREQGVMLATLPILRQNPRAKTNEWMLQRDAASNQIPPQAYQGIIVNEAGQLLEGFSSNFYAIHDGTLYTADESLVLSGISRKIVLEVAPSVLPVEQTPVTLADIASLDEAFITSTSRGVIPVVLINDHRIGSGDPGPLTQQISEKYDAWVNLHLEPI